MAVCYEYNPCIVNHHDCFYTYYICVQIVHGMGRLPLWTISWFLGIGMCLSLIAVEINKTSGAILLILTLGAFTFYSADYAIVFVHSTMIQRLLNAGSATLVIVSVVYTIRSEVCLPWVPSLLILAVASLEYYQYLQVSDTCRAEFVESSTKTRIYFMSGVCLMMVCMILQCAFVNYRRTIYAVVIVVYVVGLISVSIRELESRSNDVLIV